MWASCWASRKRWWGPICPRSARCQRGALVPQLALGQVGQRGRIRRAGDQRRQHPPARDAHDVRGHVAQLDVGPFQRLLQPIDLGRSLLDQAGAVAGQFAQFPLRPVGDEAAAQQPVAQQVGQPLGVLDVGLAPRHRLDVPRVDQQQRELLLQQVPDRLPVDPGALHRHVRAARLLQPGRQRQQLVGHRAEGAHLLDRLADPLPE